MDDPYRRLIEFQQQLAQDLVPERLPEQIMDATRKFMGVQNVVVVGIEGELLGDWWTHDDGVKVTTHSIGAIQRGLASSTGWWRGGLEENPSPSVVAANILSCVAACINLAGKNLGAIYCDIREGTRRFTDEDAMRLKLMADVFAVHVEYFHLTQMKKQQERLKQEASGAVSSLIGDTIAMKNLKADLAAAARISNPVLLLGETGVGKEVAAYSIHNQSDRSAGPLIIIHCAAIAGDLFESEMFGHEKGAFSGAHRKRRGRIELANQGTLFLDEVGDIPLQFQVKLLRVIETKRIWPVGSEVEIGPLNFRLICATNRPLKQMVQEKTFREDLYYRISGLPIRIPSLRERKEDIPVLASFFASSGSDPKLLPDSSMALLQSADWPGNVRQLKTVIENAKVLTSGSVISRNSIEKQLALYHFPTEKPSLPVEWTFPEIQRRLDSGAMEAEELQGILVPLYLNCRNNWNEVGRRLQCNRPKELRDFRNFVYYRIKTGAISLPE